MKMMGQMKMISRFKLIDTALFNISKSRLKNPND